MADPIPSAPNPVASQDAAAAPQVVAPAETVAPTPATAPGGSVVTIDEMKDALRDVYDPEIPINIVDLGLLYKIEEKDGAVNVDMTLTSPQCPIGDQIKARVIEVLARLRGVQSVNVNIVFDPLWTKEKLTFEGKLQAAMLGIM
ncbi:MAG TPA: iron-sulfur cluster assembly protein [Planctomycetota bacterium]